MPANSPTGVLKKGRGRDSRGYIVDLDINFNFLCVRCRRYRRGFRDIAGCFTAGPAWMLLGALVVRVLHVGKHEENMHDIRKGAVPIH